MLSAGRYLLGAVDLALLIGFAWLGATAVRRRLVPDLDGAAAPLATAVLAIAACSGSRSSSEASAGSRQCRISLS